MHRWPCGFAGSSLRAASSYKRTRVLGPGDHQRNADHGPAINKEDVMINLASDTVTAPPLRMLGMEALRAAWEYAELQWMNKAGLPTGDGHPVIVFPGLATDAHLTAPLRSFCESLGYTVHDWGRGVNKGPQGDVDEWLDELANDTAALIGGADTATLIGWSLGGLYARELAKLIPQKVRRVITIGTPFSGDPTHTNVATIYRLLNGQVPDLDERLRARLRQAPDVPTTSIYSRSDGVVAWQACVQAGSHPHVENLEVEGSHCGLMWNAAVLSAVAQRLGDRPRRVRRAARRMRPR
jgi:Alpha/beta hydrolase family